MKVAIYKGAGIVAIILTTGENLIRSLPNRYLSNQIYSSNNWYIPITCGN